MKAEFTFLYLLVAAGLLQKLLGQMLALPIGEHPAHHISTVNVEHDIEVVMHSPHGTFVEWGRGVTAASPSQNRACPFPSTRLKPLKRLVRDAAMPYRFRFTGALSVGCDLPDILATLAHTR